MSETPPRTASATVSTIPLQRPGLLRVSNGETGTQALDLIEAMARIEPLKLDVLLAETEAFLAKHAFRIRLYEAAARARAQPLERLLGRSGATRWREHAAAARVAGRALEEQGWQRRFDGRTGRVADDKVLRQLFPELQQDTTRHQRDLDQAAVRRRALAKARDLAKRR